MKEARSVTPGYSDTQRLLMPAPNKPGIVRQRMDPPEDEPEFTLNKSVETDIDTSNTNDEEKRKSCTCLIS